MLFSQPKDGLITRDLLVQLRDAGKGSVLVAGLSEVTPPIIRDPDPPTVIQDGFSLTSLRPQCQMVGGF
jgi:hypothetical protein